MRKFQKNKAPLLLLLPLLCVSIALAVFLKKPLTPDQRFREFTGQIFRSELSGNTLSLHYTLADPSAYGIENDPVHLGDMSRASHLASAAQTENYLNTLEQFSRDELSPKNRLTYDILKDYLKNCAEGVSYYLYEEPLSPALGVQAQLPILLAEYAFRTRRDIDNYLTLLTQIPDYFDSVMDFEEEKAASGLFMTDACAMEVLEQCSSFTNPERDNYLKQIFDEQIDSFTNLSADEKISYKQQNLRNLEAYVLPAYENLMKRLAKLLGKGKNSGGLCNLPEGKTYYEHLVHSTTGDVRPISEIEADIKNELVTVYGDIQKLLDPQSGLTSASLEEYTPSAPEDILLKLQDAITEDFPAAPPVSCQIKYVHDSLQEYLSPAFYMIPPIDDAQNNVIYINPANRYNALDLYTTLAHEGYPGHLYQTVLFQQENEEPLRSVLSYGGYVEGWATYVEMMSYSTWEENPQLASLYQKDRSLMLGIASLLDIGIHYHGYDRAHVRTFLEKFGITAENADALYTNILEAPANYLKYYVGYLNFKKLQEHLHGLLGDRFTLKEYHARVLKIGPCSFPVLKEYLNDPEFLLS